MFFLVTHRWETKDDAAASARLLQLATDAHHRAERGGWPRLASLWQDPRAREVIACWESPSRAKLSRLLARERLFDTTIRHVRQIYPPHVQGLNAMVIRPDSNWAPGRA
jgi:hypothetical protein